MELIKETTEQAWKTAVKEIYEHGIEIKDANNRVSREILNFMITITDPKDDITKPIEIMNSLKKWVYPELDELEDVFFKKDASSSYYYTYGTRIFKFANSKDQVDDFVIPLLKKYPSTRRALIVIYHPLVDSRLSSKENPCLISLYFKIINNRLTVSALLRSNDMFIGWPANIYQIYLLQKYVAEKLGIETGSITSISHSAHIFEEYDEEIKAVLGKR
jgi:thymidylate synthase